MVLLGFMAMVFALSCLAEGGHSTVFQSPNRNAQLAFHKVERRPLDRLIDRGLAGEHNRVVMCSCRVLTNDKRPLFSSAETFDIASGIPGKPNVTSCSAEGGAPELSRYAVPKGPVVRSERMTLAACEGMDGKTYKPDTTPKVACGKEACRTPSSVSVEVDTCKPYNARSQPAFWYCQASAL